MPKQALVWGRYSPQPDFEYGSIILSTEGTLVNYRAYEPYTKYKSVFPNVKQVF